MMLTHAICVLLAPALAYGAALEWALPEPTFFAPAADNWSPAPTPAPRLQGFELFRRQTTTGDNTCGYVSGSLASSITCPNKSFICATNTRNGVHGCCDPKSISSCIIPTTCIASTAMSTLCTDSFCSSAADVVKCTESALPDCYQWIIQYDTTSMTQHGCTSKGFTSTALRLTGQLQSSIPPERYRTVTVEVTPSATPTPTQTASPSKPSLGAIIGGTIGGCTAISIVAVIAYLLYRRRKQARDSIKQPPMATTQFHSPNGAVTEYSPSGFPTPTLSESEMKWQQHQGPVNRASDAMPQYPHMGTGHYGVVEVDGMQRPVEAPGEIEYLARGYVRS